MFAQPKQSLTAASITAVNTIVNSLQIWTSMRSGCISTESMDLSESHCEHRKHRLKGMRASVVMQSSLNALRSFRRAGSPMYVIASRIRAMTKH